MSDPFVFLQNPRASNDDDESIYMSAKSLLKGGNLTPLLSLLRSEDIIVSRRGLYLFSQLGKESFAILNDALKHTDHPHLMARNNILDGVLKYSADLTPEQTKELIAMISNAEDIICAKIITFLSAIDFSIVSEAINLLPDQANKKLHLKALKLFNVDMSDSQLIFDKAISSSKLNKVFMLAGLEKAAREKVVWDAPTYYGNEFIEINSIANIERILNKNLRKLE